MKTSTSCRLLILLAAAFTFSSCTRTGDSHAEAPDTSRQVDVRPAPANLPDACTLAAALPGSLDEIARSASRLLAGPDSCVTGLIDSLESIAGRGNGMPALAALDSLSRAADGYAGEAISTAMPTIFRRSPETVARYLIDNRSRGARPLEDALVNGFTMERPTQIDPEAQLKLDRHLFELVGNGMTLAPAERAYLDSFATRALARTPG